MSEPTRGILYGAPVRICPDGEFVQAIGPISHAWIMAASLVWPWDGMVLAYHPDERGRGYFRALWHWLRFAPKRSR